jgi:hypothetical protein
VVFFLFPGLFLALGKIHNGSSSTATIHSKLAGLEREKDYLVTSWHQAGHEDGTVLSNEAATPAVPLIRR